MSQEMVLQVVQQFFYTIALLVLPILAVTLLVGVLVSLFQAITNMQEQTLVLIPKMLAVMALLFVLLPWMLQVLVSLTIAFFGYLVVITRQ